MGVSRGILREVICILISGGLLEKLPIGFPGREFSRQIKPGRSSGYSYKLSGSRFGSRERKK